MLGVSECPYTNAGECNTQTLHISTSIVFDEVRHYPKSTYFQEDYAGDACDIKRFYNGAYKRDMRHLTADNKNIYEHSMSTFHP
uniref:Metalloendopeptidase n=1 Tax=Ascaris lumbricoides TaxID=6252 RepID=A0A0M3IKF7_ASCLU